MKKSSKVKVLKSKGTGQKRLEDGWKANVEKRTSWSEVGPGPTGNDSRKMAKGAARLEFEAGSTLDERRTRSPSRKSRSPFGPRPAFLAGDDTRARSSSPRERQAGISSRRDSLGSRRPLETAQDVTRKKTSAKSAWSKSSATKTNPFAKALPKVDSNKMPSASAQGKDDVDLGPARRTGGKASVFDDVTREKNDSVGKKKKVDKTKKTKATRRSERILSMEERKDVMKDGDESELWSLKSAEREDFTSVDDPDISQRRQGETRNTIDVDEVDMPRKPPKLMRELSTISWHDYNLDQEFEDLDTAFSPSKSPSFVRQLSTSSYELLDDSTSSQDPSEFTEKNSGAKGDDSNIFGGLSAPPEILARGPRARRAYTEAARDGTKKVFRTRLMLVGQERVGKTSLKKSLTGQGFDKHEAITDGVETTDACEINIQIAKTSGKVWSIHKATPTQEDTKDDEYTKALADEIAKRLMISTPKEVTSEPPPVTDVTDGRSTSTSHEEHPMSPPTSAEITVPAQITSLVEKMLVKQVHQKADKHNGEGDGETNGEVSLSIWDFAGHDVYYTTHQVFLTWRAVYIIVFDLSRDLDSAVPPDSRDGFYETAKGNSKSELTCLQFINFWLCSIFAHAVAPSSVSNKKGSSKTHQKSPPIFIVGTHRESVPGDAVHKKKKIDEAFTKIRKNIKKKPYECHVIPHYYAIENSLGDTDEELVSLREHIERVAVEEPYMGEEIPLRWLLFEEALAAGQINFMTLDQTKDLTRPVGMATERELLTMLTFYHDLGYIVYFGDLEDDQSLLRDIVILNPQWLINVFKQVITILDPSKRDGIVSDAWTRLEDEGILEDRLIQHMWQGCLEQKGALVELMAKFDLICEAPADRAHQSSMSDEDLLESHVEGGEHTKTTCFYVPTRLTPRCSNEEIGEIKSSLDFYVDFRGFLPEGLFHRLMTRAVRWMNERDGHPVFLFYRQISLMPDGEHQALFDMLPPHDATIKVTVFRSEVADLDDDDDGDDYNNDDKPPDPEVVNQVMTFMTDTLSSLRRRWAKRIQYDVCFACPKCKKRKPLKDCLNKKSVRCGLHAINAGSVRSKFGIDPSGTNSGTESPRISRKVKKILCPVYFNDLAMKIGAEWQQLGIRLGLTQADLDHVCENKQQATDRIFAMLSMWHQRKSARGDERKLIEELCRALSGCDRTDLSDCIQSEAGID